MCGVRAFDRRTDVNGYGCAGRQPRKSAYKSAGRMADPQETLAVFAEVAVALAGFSGIVIAFGQRSVGELTALEYRRLSNLFILSGMALSVALVSLSLLHLGELDEPLFWRLCSVTVFVLAAPWLVYDVIRVLRLEREERARISCSSACKTDPSGGVIGVQN